MKGPFDHAHGQHDLFPTRLRLPWFSQEMWIVPPINLLPKPTVDHLSGFALPVILTVAHGSRVLEHICRCFQQSGVSPHGVPKRALLLLAANHHPQGSTSMYSEWLYNPFSE